VGETSYFLAIAIKKTVRDNPKLLLMTNRKLHMRFVSLITVSTLL